MIKVKHTLAIRMVYSVLKNMGIMVASHTQYLAVQKQDPVHYWSCVNWELVSLHFNVMCEQRASLVTFSYVYALCVNWELVSLLLCVKFNYVSMSPNCFGSVYSSNLTSIEAVLICFREFFAELLVAVVRLVGFDCVQRLISHSLHTAPFPRHGCGSP